VHRGGDVVPSRPEEVTAETALGGEADGVQYAVETAPALLQLGAQRAEVFRIGDVELQDVGFDRQLPGHPLRQAHGPSERCQHDLGALLLGAAGHREGDGLIGEYAGDQDALAFQQHAGTP
jgi:hypothetical protein